MAKRNTKIVLASLLATSAIVPAVAASAEVGGETTRTLEAGDAVTTSLEGAPISVEEGTLVSLGTITFEIEDSSGFIGRHLGTEGELVELEGKQYIVINLPEAAGNIVTSVTVGDEEILNKSEEQVYLLVPVNEDLEPVTATVSAMGQALDVILTPGELVEEGSNEEVVTDEEETNEEVVTDEETNTDVNQAVAPLKYEIGYGDILDGEYEVEVDFIDLDTGEGGYRAMAAHLETTATLVVEDGEYYLDIQAKEGSNPLITDYYLLEDEETLESIQGSQEEYPHTVRVPLTDLNNYTEMAVHVYAETPMMTIDKPYEFGIVVKPGQALTEAVETYVYKDGSNELSVMNGQYLSATSNVTLTEEGKYSVDLTFPQNQHVVEFIFAGETVAATSTEKDEAGNEIGIYTVEVEDLTNIYNATVDLHVKAEIGGKPFEYKEAYDVQIQFGGEKNPFGDITKSWAYSNVVSLYNKGIFKAADQFNPRNNLERGHFALMLARAFELDVPETTTFTDLRKDVEEQNAIKALNAYGIINGKTGTTFAPSDKILRYEAALMIDRLLKKYNINVEDKGASFTDISTQSAEAKAAITKLAYLEIINGKGEGKFDPKGTLTREEMAKILDNALKLIEKQ